MIKKLVDKKIALFKEAFPDYKVSANGNFYYMFYVPKITKIKSIYAVTRNTLHKLGGELTFEDRLKSRGFMITPRGKLMYKIEGYLSFQLVTLKRIQTLEQYPQEKDDYQTRQKAAVSEEKKEQYEIAYRKLKECFFVGKKAEWLKDHSYLWHYQYFQGFTSLKQAKNHLGLSFISDDEFVQIVGSNADHFKIAVLMYPRSNADKVSAVQLITKGKATTFLDYIRMAEEMGLPFQVPAGVNKLKRLHDDTVLRYNRKKLDTVSDAKTYYISDAFSKWDRAGLEYEILDSPRALAYEGMRQNHCIGSYADRVEQYIFVSFLYKGKNYSAQISLTGEITQIEGKYRKPPPPELLALIKEGLIGEEEVIIKVKKEPIEKDITPYRSLNVLADANY